MSTLRVDNLEDLSAGDTVDMTYIVNGTAKVRWSYNQTVPALRPASLNVSSVTDNSNGNFTLNFTNSFAAGYVPTGMVDTQGASIDTGALVVGSAGFTTLSFAGSLTDMTSTGIILGDLV